jgi:hypothetical protein
MGSGRKLRPHNARGEPPRAISFSVVPILIARSLKRIATPIPAEIVKKKTHRAQAAKPKQV